jgi:hypothetical protein
MRHGVRHQFAARSSRPAYMALDMVIRAMALDMVIRVIDFFLRFHSSLT